MSTLIGLKKIGGRMPNPIPKMTTCLAITPARDEGRFLPGLIASMRNQTFKPDRWIVVDDGSSDSSGRIIDRAAARHSWIEAHHLPRREKRAEGGESVIVRFLQPEVWQRFDYILRLDADLSFDPDFVRALLDEFALDPRLGIAGPTLYEPARSGWREIRQPMFHIRGAAKMYRRACFAVIGGLHSGLGWDTIDEVRAMMAGFKTRCFTGIRALHHRPQGAAGGRWRSSLAAGCAAYQAGYSPLFLAARAARTALTRRSPAAGLALAAGYVREYWRAGPRAASPEMVRFVRRQQIRRLTLRESLWR
jgi:poly-beta-1,6-N-acetyl-D-glucosamine synthase